MTIMKGDYGIEICMKDVFGKRPGLYVIDKRGGLKVGNFASEEKAKIFEEYLKYFCNLADKPEDIKGDKDE